MSRANREQRGLRIHSKIWPVESRPLVASWRELSVPLDPFDPNGAPHSTLAHAQCEIEVEGEIRCFLLRVWGNFLFFCEKDELVLTNREPVFGLFKPLAGTAERAKVLMESPEILAHIFRREFAAGRWGFFCPHDAWRTGQLVHLMRWDGVALSRHWWDDRRGHFFRFPLPAPYDSPRRLLDWRRIDLHREAMTPEEDAMETDRIFFWHHRMEELGKAENFTSILQKRPIFARHRAEWKFHFQTGNAADLENLVRWLWRSETKAWAETQALTATCSSVSPTHAARLSSRYEPYKSAPVSSRFHFLDSLILKHHRPVGFYWQRAESENNEPRPPASQAAGWDYWSYEYEWPIEAPTMHEKLEAILNLKKWAHTFMDEADVNYLFASETGDFPDSGTDSPLNQMYRRYL